MSYKLSAYSKVGNDNSTGSKQYQVLPSFLPIVFPYFNGVNRFRSSAKRNLTAGIFLGHPRGRRSLCRRRRRRRRSGLGDTEELPSPQMYIYILAKHFFGARLMPMNPITNNHGG
jgi:hypothetical protein